MIQPICAESAVKHQANKQTISNFSANTAQNATKSNNMNRVMFCST